jgi:hypothetical protein
MTMKQNDVSTNAPEYITPEIVELGDAGTMTLGCTGTNSDNCVCAKCNGDTEFA